MIRIVLVASTVILFLTFAIPVMLYLERKMKRDPERAQWRSLKIVKAVFRFILKIAGVTYEAYGLENIPPDRAVLYVGNHRSYFDILVGYVTVPGLTGFVAKKEMLRYPFLRNWMRLVNCVFLDRKNVKEALKSIMEAIGKLRSGISIWIFPEGTRNVNDRLTDLMEFREGSLKMAEKSGCPVIPVAISGTAAIFEDHMPWIRPGHVVIRFGEPIDLKSLAGEEKKFPGAYVRGKLISMLEEMENSSTEERV